MSKINAPVLYQIETFSSGYRQGSSRGETQQRSNPAPKTVPGVKPRREPEFLVQLMTSDDPDFRKVLGRLDVARAREAAYAFATAHKPSHMAGLVSTASRQA